MKAKGGIVRLWPNYDKGELAAKVKLAHLIPLFNKEGLGEI